MKRLKIEAKREEECESLLFGTDPQKSERVGLGRFGLGLGLWPLAFGFG